MLLLAPKDGRVYAALSPLFIFTGDREAMRDLARRLENTEVDLTDVNRRMLENYQGKNDDKYRKEKPAEAKRLQATLKSVEKIGGVTWAAAVGDWVRAQAEMDRYDLPTNLDDVVALADKAYQTAPSRGSQTSLLTALLARAHRTLMKQPAYAARVKPGLRSVSAQYLIAAALSGDGPARQACLANADVQRAVDLMRQSRKSFASEGHECLWAMLRASDPDEAARVAKVCRENEFNKISSFLAKKLGPLNVMTVCNEYWAAQMEGDRARAAAVVREASARGVPLPFDEK